MLIEDDHQAIDSDQQTIVFRTLVARLRRFLDQIERSPLSVAAAIFTIAIIVRGLILIVTPSSQIFWQCEAENVAKSLATHGTFANPFEVATGPTAHCNPFFPFLMAIFFRVAGFGVQAYYLRAIAEILATSLLYALLPSIAVRFRIPRMAGIAAGVLCALLLPSLSVEVWRAWDEPYVALALALALIFTYRVFTTKHVWYWAIPYGLLWGAMLYASAVLTAVIAGLFLTDVVFVKREPLQLKVRWWVTAAACIVLSVAPWIIRNHSTFGAWFLMRSNFGLELYIANNDGAQPTQKTNILQGSMSSLHPFLNPEKARELAAIGEYQYYKQRRSDAMRWIATHPSHFAQLTLARIAYFWFPPRVAFPQNVAVGLLTPLAFLGLVMLYRQNRAAFAVVLPVLILFPLPYYLMMYSARYRVPITWLIFLTASIPIARLLSKRRRHRVEVIELATELSEV